MDGLVCEIEKYMYQHLGVQFSEQNMSGLLFEDDYVGDNNCI